MYLEYLKSLLGNIYQMPVYDAGDFEKVELGLFIDLSSPGKIEGGKDKGILYYEKEIDIHCRGLDDGLLMALFYDHYAESDFISLTPLPGSHRIEYDTYQNFESISTFLMQASIPYNQVTEKLSTIIWSE